VAAAIVACSDSSAPTRVLSTDNAFLGVFNPVGGFPTPETAQAERLEVCKRYQMSSGAPVPATTSFNFTSAADPSQDQSFDITSAANNVYACREIWLDGGTGGNVTVTEPAIPGFTTRITRIEDIAGAETTPVNDVLGNSLTGLVSGSGGANNASTGQLFLFTNIEIVVPPPDPEVCDFITFGRLVTEFGGKKVVISGNAGGNSPHGGFLNEFHIEVNGVDHHVADITSYGPIAAAPLATTSYPNSRHAAGLDKHGHAVELRVWDGGEPGWKYDRFWFNVNGVIVGDATDGNLINQGNMQYHSNCRGPGN